MACLQEAMIKVGQRFSKLTVARNGGSAVHYTWQCKCDCGKLTFATAASLTRGLRKSCGCAKKQHGRSPEWVSWRCMIARCTYPQDKSYAHYGGSGITVCERWMTFGNFLEDMGKRPLGMTLDRFPNRNGNYEPGNCRWATTKEQIANRNPIILSVDDVNEIRGRHEHGERARSIAKRFNLSVKYTGQIIRSEVWKSIAPCA